MEFIGTLNRIGELKKITNAITGKTFVKRDITIIVPEDYYSREGQHKQTDNELVFTLIFDTAENFNMTTGTKVKIYYTSSVSGDTYMYENKVVRRINFV